MNDQGLIVEIKTAADRVAPVRPSWLEPKCEHWRDWKFPYVRISSHLDWWRNRA